MTDAGIQLDVIGMALCQHSFQFQRYVRVVNVQLSVNVAFTVETVDVDILIGIVVVVKLVDDPLCRDRRIVVSRPLAVEPYVGG